MTRQSSLLFLIKKWEIPTLVALARNDGALIFFALFKIMCYICGAIALVADIFDESVFAFILEWKSGKFSMEQGEQHTRHRVLVLWHFRCPIPANTGVGYCLFVPRYSRTSIQINKNQPHTFFILYNCLIRGWWANKKTYLL